MSPAAVKLFGLQAYTLLSLFDCLLLYFGSGPRDLLIKEPQFPNFKELKLLVFSPHPLLCSPEVDILAQK